MPKLTAKQYDALLAGDKLAKANHLSHFSMNILSSAENSKPHEVLCKDSSTLCNIASAIIANGYATRVDLISPIGERIHTWEKGETSEDKANG